MSLDHGFDFAIPAPVNHRPMEQAIMTKPTTKTALKARGSKGHEKNRASIQAEALDRPTAGASPVPPVRLSASTPLPALLEDWRAIKRWWDTLPHEHDEEANRLQCEAEDLILGAPCATPADIATKAAYLVEMVETRGPEMNCVPVLARQIEAALKSSSGNAAVLNPKADRATAEVALNVAPTLVELIDAEVRTRKAYGDALTATDEVARVKAGLSPEPSEAEIEEDERAEQAHDAAQSALRAYQPTTATELAILAGLFAGGEFGDDAASVLARMAEGLAFHLSAATAPRPLPVGTLAKLVEDYRAAVATANSTDERDEAADTAAEKAWSAALDAVLDAVLNAKPNDLEDLVALIDFFKFEHDEDPVGVAYYRGKRPIEHLHAAAMGLLASCGTVDLDLGGHRAPETSLGDDAELLRLEAEWDAAYAERLQKLPHFNRLCTGANEAAFAEIQALRAQGREVTDSEFSEIHHRHYEASGADEYDLEGCDVVFDRVEKRCRELPARILEGLRIKTKIVNRWREPDPDESEVDCLLADLSRMLGLPCPTVRMPNGYEYLNAKQYVNAWLDEGGNFVRQPDGSMWIGGPVPRSDRMEALMRASGELPFPDGTTREGCEGFMEQVVDVAVRMMLTDGTNHLIDHEAWKKHARPAPQRDEDADAQ